jgi:hypothetical protein
MTEFVIIPGALPPRNNRRLRAARQSISAFLKLCSAKGCMGFRETKMRNGGRVLLAVINSYVEIKISDIRH